MERMDELISVIVPVYNGEAYIKRITDTLRRQTYGNLEIIVVDDGSKDGTLRLCHQHMDTDKRFRIFHKENGGVSAARNFGKEKATGAYIAFIDVDDVILPEYFRYLHGLIEKYGADMSCCNYYKMRDTEKMPDFDDTGEEICFTSEEALKNLFYRRNITGYPFLKLYRKEGLADVCFWDGIRYDEDLLFAVSALKKCRKVVFGDRMLYIYYQNDASAVHNVDCKALEDSWRFIRREIWEYVKRERPELYSALCTTLFMRGSEYCCYIWKEAAYRKFRETLLEEIRLFAAYVSGDTGAKKKYRIMATVGTADTRMLIRLCRCYKFLVRKKWIQPRKAS